MAIIRYSKNYEIKVKEDYIIISKEIAEISEEVEIVALKDNLSISSNNKVLIKGKNE